MRPFITYLECKSGTDSRQVQAPKRERFSAPWWRRFILVVGQLISQKSSNRTLAKNFQESNYFLRGEHCHKRYGPFAFIESQHICVVWTQGMDSIWSLIVSKCRQTVLKWTHELYNGVSCGLISFLYHSILAWKTKISVPLRRFLRKWENTTEAIKLRKLPHTKKKANCIYFARCFLYEDTRFLLLFIERHTDLSKLDTYSTRHFLSFCKIPRWKKREG